MGFFDKFTASNAGRKAYGMHVVGNRLYDQNKAAEAKQKHGEALALYEKAMAAGCDNPVYMMAYAVLLLRMGQYEQAREYLLKADKSKTITKDQRKQLRINFAICQWKLGNLDSAIEQLKIAKQDTRTSLIYGSLGYMLIEQGERDGDFTEALEFNTEALDYDDEDAVVLDNMGQLYLRMGKRDEAVEYFKKAHERKPKQTDTLYYLALLALEDGDKEAARGYVSTALEGNFSALCTVSRAKTEELAKKIG